MESDPPTVKNARIRIENENVIEELKEKLIRQQQASYAMERLHVSALETASLVVSADGGRFYHAAGYAVDEDEAVTAFGFGVG